MNLFGVYKLILLGHYKYALRRIIYVVFIVIASIFFCFSNTAQAQSVVTYFHNDISGSPMVATDAAGNVVWKESYKPYGDKQRNELASRDGKNKIGFAGSPHDASTGLSYMGARYYNPVIGRFMGVDPVGFQENNIHSFNRYAYANNNPYKFVDRDGRIALPLLLGIGALATGSAYLGFQPPEKQRALAARLQRALSNVFSSESSESQPAGGSKIGTDKPSRPTDIVGDQSDPRAGPNDKGGKWTSGPLSPGNGGTGDFDKDLDKLTGGTRPWQPGDKAPPGSLVGPNGIFGRNPNSSGGKSIDIPANGGKPHETLHYP